MSLNDYLSKDIGKNYRKPLFTFFQEDGKWKSKVNAETGFYFFTTYGFPFEMFVEEINKLDKMQLLKIKLEDWIEFSKNKTV